MRDVLRLSLPLTLWLISFSALYALHGLVCAGAWGATPGPGNLAWGRIALVALGLAAVLLQTAAIVLLARSTAGFIRTTSLALAVVALVATAWTAAPAALLPLCTG